MGGQQATAISEREQFAPPSGPDQPAFGAPWAPIPSAEAHRRPFRSVLRAAGPAFGAAIERERARGTGFLFLPVFMATGAMAYFAASEEPGSVPITISAVLFAVLAAGLRSQPTARAACLFALMTMLGMLAGKAETWRAQTQMNGSSVTTRVTGTVARIEHQASGRVRLTIDVARTARPELRYAPERVRLTARAVPPGLAPGDALTGVARLMPLSGPVRPGGYDFAFMSYFDGIGASGFFMGNPERINEALPRTASRGALWIEGVRLALAERVRARVGGAEGEIAATLIAGMRAGIPEATSEALRRTGLAHILAISGLHMALVAVTVMGALRYGFALFPAWASRHPTKKYAAAAALLACAFYLALSGAAVAAQRSFIMLAVMLVALIFDRAALTMRNLAIAALIILAVSPHEVTGPSFQMSFAATAVLIGAYSAWSEHRARRSRRAYVELTPLRKAWRMVLLFTAGLAATSVLAGLATTLYGVHHFHRVSPYALGANMLAMPIVSLLVMPMAVLSVVAMPFGIDWLFLDVMGRGIAAVNAVAAWFSERSPIDAVGAVPVLSVAFLSAALVLATLLRTWLRLLALPVALAGFLVMSERELPDVMVSEDGRLIAMRTPDGNLAVNRDRPNAFTLQNWMMALAAEDWRKPEDAGATAQTEQAAARFLCTEGLCVAGTEDGARIVHAADAAIAAPHCGHVEFIVIADATARNPCPNAGPLVITSRDLARRGSAAVHFAHQNGRPVAKIRFAISEPYRPWHAHRAFSREARGLPSHRQ